MLFYFILFNALALKLSTFQNVSIVIMGMTATKPAQTNARIFATRRLGLVYVRISLLVVLNVTLPVNPTALTNYVIKT